MKRLLQLLLIIPLASTAQGSGIKFEDALNWSQIMAKAKAEHKYIFVDCYATWCGPCKQMDENIYPIKDVGDVYNKQFVSVKVQMDKTSADNEQTKNWYRTADILMHNYTVNAYPTFLFFDPDGNPVHKIAGTRDAAGFIRLAAEAQDPGKQYYHILKNFRPGELDTAEEKGLARSLANSDKDLSAQIALDYLTRIPKKELGTSDNGKLMVQFKNKPEIVNLAVDYIKSLSEKVFISKANVGFMQAMGKPEVKAIVVAYVQTLSKKSISDEKNMNLMESFGGNSDVRKVALQYIDQLAEKEINTPDMIKFVAAFDVQTPTDKGFNFFYHHTDQVNTIMKDKTYVQEWIKGVIETTDLYPLITSAQKTDITPNLDSVGKNIKERYNADYADEVVLDGKIQWYSYLIREKKQEKYWHDLLDAQINKERKYWAKDSVLTIMQTYAINNTSYDAFKHSDDPSQLKLATNWMKYVVEQTPKDDSYLDTYACALYKAGYQQEAARWEQKNIDQLVADGKAPQSYIDVYKRKVAAMQRNEKIWLVKEFQ